MTPTEWLRMHWWVFLLLVITLGGTIGREGGHPAGAAVLAGIAVVVLLVRESSPQTTVLVNAAATTAYFGIGYANGPVYLSVFFSAYALASRRPTARWWPYAAAYLASAAGLAARLADRAERPILISLQVGWFLALVAASLAVGIAVRSRSETRRERVARTATEERLRMAEDLHDGVGHGLAVIAMQAGVALHVLERDPAAVRASLEAIRDTSRESLDALRSSLSRLAPTEREAPRTPRRGLADLPVLLSRVRAGGLDVTADVGADEVPDSVDETAYVVVQEALTNVLRHAAARSARVVVAVEGGGLLVRVSDDGQGGSVASDGGSGLGIPGMRARVERLGGTFWAGPAQDGPGEAGFVVRAWLPLAVRT